MSNRKKILIYADSPNWAYDHGIEFCKKYLSEEIDLYYDYIFCHEYREETGNFLENFKKDCLRTKKNVYKIFNKKPFDYNYQLLFKHKMTPFWIRSFLFNGKFYSRRVLPPWKIYDVIFYFDFYFDFYACLSKRSKFKIKGIYTEEFPPQGLRLDYKAKLKGLNMENLIDNKDIFFKRYFKNIDLFSAGSSNILNEYSCFPIPKTMLMGFNDDTLFFTNQEKIFHKESLVIGWTGNPSRSFKNYFTIIQPVIEELIQEGYNIEFRTRFEGPYYTLPDFYKEIDLILIASTADAGPSLFAEASLCGIPAISTRVGYPNMVIKDGINGYLVDLDKKLFKEKILRLYNDRNLLKRFADRIRNDYESILGLDVTLKRYREAFKL